jgi:CheY-like chemotaxis protein
MSICMTPSPLNSQPPRLRIFVVENDPDTLKYLIRRLERLGHSVQHAESMAAALAALPTSGCEVLLSDIGLPDGDGWELMRSVRFTSPVFAIAMSGYGMAADLENSRSAGFRHHLVKPFSRQALDALLAEAASELAKQNAIRQ